MRILQDLSSQIKAVSPRTRERLFFLAVLALVAVLSFGVGRLSVIYGETESIQVLTPDEAAAMVSAGYPPPPSALAP